jgi:hypothetical protein
MISPDIGPYRPRPIRFLELWTCGDWRLKVYGICAHAEFPRQELVEAGKRIAERLLRDRPTRQRHYGAGFLGVHDGQGENQVFLDRWVNRNELLHEYWVSPPNRPAELRAADTDHNSVCVWDLAVQCFERRAWIECAMREPGLEAYLARRLNEDV